MTETKPDYGTPIRTVTADAWLCEVCRGSTNGGCIIKAQDKGGRINQPVLCPYDSKNHAYFRVNGTPPGRLH